MGCGHQPITSLECELLFHITCSGLVVWGCGQQLNQDLHEQVIPFLLFRNKCANNGDNCPLDRT